MSDLSSRASRACVLYPDWWDSVTEEDKAAAFEWIRDLALKEVREKSASRFARITMLSWGELKHAEHALSERTRVQPVDLNTVHGEFEKAEAYAANKAADATATKESIVTALELSASILRYIECRAPGTKGFVDYDAFIINEINPALAKARNL